MQYLCAGFIVRTFLRKVVDARFCNLDRKITHNFFQKLQYCRLPIIYYIIENLQGASL